MKDQAALTRSKVCCLSFGHAYMGCNPDIHAREIVVCKRSNECGTTSDGTTQPLFILPFRLIQTRCSSEKTMSGVHKALFPWQSLCCQVIACAKRGGFLNEMSPIPYGFHRATPTWALGTNRETTKGFKRMKYSALPTMERADSSS